MKFYITLIIFIALLCVAFIFGSQNNQSITLNYLIARADITVAEAVSLFTLIGFFLGLLTSLLWKFMRSLNKQVNPAATKGKR